MRRAIINFLFITGTAMLVLSCKKSELTIYEQPDMIYVYKDAFNQNRDSITYSFAVKPNTVTTDTVKVSVRIMGVAKNVAREVKLSIVPSGTTAAEGTHFSFLPYSIPAGAYSANLPILVKRTAGMKLQEFRLQVQIEESKDFKPGVYNTPVNGNLAGGGLQYLVKINDFLTKPGYWDAQVSYYGTYSQVKYKFMIDVTGRTDFQFGAPPALSYGETLYYKAFCKTKLAEYNAINGPLIDEFGQPVTFP